ncbi:NAD-glutamate dehydrogenase domain-containing protein [Rhodococcus sp. P1Y]|uniref:NAD-glutamate dehydrogenase domain-containing protein n=1 Tax=Rhodococcus sp. P1Y TaxID=1302308 RepID=UPI000EAE3985|nr:NAD-glutamate dehydrogenase domain-containing protein [Rhodococcus sp. P1Y]AYJ48263.1 glutamate dehydrogenase [Rhodococcus sp. P1Y]
MPNATTVTARKMQFDGRNSCIITWPEGEPSLAELTESFADLGLRPLTHRPLPPAGGSSGSMHMFTFEPVSFPDTALTKLAAAFDAKAAGETQLDIYSRLIATADVGWREAALIRALCRFLLQADIGFSENYIVDTLEQQPAFVAGLIALFASRFDPITVDRDRTTAAALTAVDTHVDEARTLDQDRILRALRSFVLATLRTNWYQRDDLGRVKPWASFKLDSRLLTATGPVVPFREIYVHARHVEGVHLRSSLVARGGLRWSDRPEDFRTEALSLMKTQSVKNAPIVPGGAKGAFVTIGPGEDRDTAAVRAYSTFVRGILDVTDNIVDGQIVRPPNTIAYDDEDAYLVVAADKGTASFSDTANAIAREYRYWLGDAFASGGSVGYDHKAMGITARGAWVAVRRHFLERDLDVDTDEFDVVGIGDMSGDVFGNGMLLSRSIKLVAAFDHRHIFIDPLPNAERSFVERRRLFDLPRSTWSDYDRELISEGGGVWPRTAKSITLSGPARAALGIDDTTLTPHDLIKAILCAPVDLLWNGGVGTYVRASDESNADAADPANDAVRVAAAALRTTVVGEGGNLGFTQRARIEYATRGGRINADFIDNAAGVATSDLEVNLKISLGTVANDERDTLLSSVTDEVAEAVLRSSRDQTLAISVAERRAPSLLDQHDRLIEDLCATGVLDRHSEVLPDETTLAARAAAGLGLVRPEVAVLVAQSKNILASELLASSVPENVIFSGRLAEYFPESVRNAAGDSLVQHRLGREIAATSIADELVNRLGPGVFYRLEERLGVKSPLGALAYGLVCAVLPTDQLRDDILASGLPASDMLDSMVKLQQLIESEMVWVLRRPGVTRRLAIDSSADIARWRPPVTVLAASDSVQGRIESLFGALGLADAAIQGNTSVELVSKVHHDLARRLDLTSLLVGTGDTASTSHWDMMGCASVHARIGDTFSELVGQVLDNFSDSPEPVSMWLTENSDRASRFTASMSRSRRGGTVDLAHMCAVEAELELLVR